MLNEWQMKVLAEAESIDYDAFNTSLQKLLSGLKSSAHARIIRQNYKGTGEQKAKRQIFVRFADGSPMDIWLLKGSVDFEGSAMTPDAKLPKAFSYAGMTPEEAYAKIKKGIIEWYDSGRKGIQYEAKTDPTLSNRARGFISDIKNQNRKSVTEKEIYDYIEKKYYLTGKQAESLFDTITDELFAKNIDIE
jgi:hypothetical protein